MVVSTKHAALAIIFMLTIREVQAIRECAHSTALSRELSNTYQKELAQKKFSEAVSGLRNLTESGAAGEPVPVRFPVLFRNLGEGDHYKQRDVELHLFEVEQFKMVKLTILDIDHVYIILPDALVGNPRSSKANDADTVKIVGYKRVTSNVPLAETESVYDKAKALEFRFPSPLDKVVGVTNEASMKPGKPVYKSRNGIKAGEPFRLNHEGSKTYLWGLQYDRHEPRDTEVKFSLEDPHLEGEHKRFVAPDPTKTMTMLITTMSAQTTCVGNKLCTFQCVYNPDEGTCGPERFCELMRPAHRRASAVGNVLVYDPSAPFGGHPTFGQKCRAVIGDTPAKNDAQNVEILTLLKEDAKARIKELHEQTHTQAQTEAGATVFMKSLNLLSLLEMLPNAFLVENSPEAKHVQVPDAVKVAHASDFQSRTNGLQPDTYRAVQAMGLEAFLADETASVPARLLSELVRWMAAHQVEAVQRMAKTTTDDKCNVNTGDGTLDIFLDARFQVPGAQVALKDIPDAECQEKLREKTQHVVEQDLPSGDLEPLAKSMLHDVNGTVDDAQQSLVMSGLLRPDDGASLLQVENKGFVTVGLILLGVALVCLVTAVAIANVDCGDHQGACTVLTGTFLVAGTMCLIVSVGMLAWAGAMLSGAAMMGWHGLSVSMATSFMWGGSAIAGPLAVINIFLVGVPIVVVGAGINFAGWQLSAEALRAKGINPERW